MGHDSRGLAIRATFVVRGVVNAVLGGQAVRLYRGLSGSSGASERDIATEALRWPLGDWFVVLAGLSLIGFAVQQVRRRRLVPRSVGNRHDGVVIPYAR